MENREPKNRRTGTRRVNQEPRKGAEENTSRGEEDIQEQSSITDLQSPISKATDNRQQTTDNKEQIGDLIYLPNAEYPYPFPVTRPPHYWMTEQTGRLAEAVELYVSGDPLTPAALDLIRQYLRQYLERAVMTGDANRNVLIGKLATLRTAREIERFADELAEIGVEPF
jgi:hypothetical protein